MNSKWARNWFAWYHAVFCAVIIALALWLLFGPVFAPVKPMMLGFAGVLMGLQFTAVSFEYKRTVRIAFGLAMLGMAAILAGFGMCRIAVSPMIAPYAHDADGALAAVGYTEPSLVYYSGHAWRMYGSSQEELDKALAGKPAMIAVLRRQSDMGMMLGFNHKTATDSPVALSAQTRLTNGYVRASVEGLNIGRFSWVTVDVYLDIDRINVGKK